MPRWPAAPEDAVLGHLLPSFEGVQAPPWLLRRVAAGTNHGVTVFLRANAADAEGIAALTEQLHAAASGTLPLLIGADQEGGQLVGLGKDTTRFPGAMALGAADDSLLTEATRPGHGPRVAGAGRDRRLRAGMRRGRGARQRIARHARLRLGPGGDRSPRRGIDARAAGGRRGGYAEALPGLRGRRHRPALRAAVDRCRHRWPRVARTRPVPRSLRSRCRHGHVWPRGPARCDGRPHASRHCLAPGHARAASRAASASVACPSPTPWT